MFVISLLESNIKALLAAAVPAATPVIGVNVVEIPEMLLISVAVAVIAVPFNVKLPVDKLVSVPIDVILGWAAVCKVPVKLAAVKELMFVIFLLESNIKALLATPAPAVAPANDDKSAIVPENLIEPDKLISPLTSNVYPGVSIPIPILPSALIIIFLVLDAVATFQLPIKRSLAESETSVVPDWI